MDARPIGERDASIGRLLYGGIVNQKNGEITTKKEDKTFHGIGLKSVRAAVNNHNGTMNVDFDNKEFRVNIMLYL
ncbi:MAG: GHKL domain-containing protein [Lachnospiraceae bacterium]|nr:GHKL domain-containing protein [Lachnospiraceae bacterium]